MSAGIGAIICTSSVFLYPPILPPWSGFGQIKGVNEATLQVDNGQWAKDNRQRMMDNEFHDLQGRWVARPSKGLYIVNGRKVVVK